MNEWRNRNEKKKLKIKSNKNPSGNSIVHMSCVVNVMKRFFFFKNAFSHTSIKILKKQQIKYKRRAERDDENNV